MQLVSSETLLALMRQRGIGVRRLARYVGIDQAFISRLCNGHKRTCKPRTAELIAEALDVPVSLLFVERTSRPTARTGSGVAA